ncbi:unnamed protein product, partial [Protopolystoma xenopodis]
MGSGRGVSMCSSGIVTEGCRSIVQMSTFERRNRFVPSSRQFGQNGGVAVGRDWPGWALLKADLAESEVRLKSVCTRRGLWRYWIGGGWKRFAFHARMYRLKSLEALAGRLERCPSLDWRQHRRFGDCSYDVFRLGFVTIRIAILIVTISVTVAVAVAVAVVFFVFIVVHLVVVVDLRGFCSSLERLVKPRACRLVGPKEQATCCLGFLFGALGGWGGYRPMAVGQTLQLPLACHDWLMPLWRWSSLRGGEVVRDVGDVRQSPLGWRFRNQTINGEAAGTLGIDIPHGLVTESGLELLPFHRHRLVFVQPGHRQHQSAFHRRRRLARGVSIGRSFAAAPNRPSALAWPP